MVSQLDPGQLPESVCRYTLKKSQKFKHRKDFDELKSRGESLSSPTLTVLWLPAESTSCGVICSKKYSLLSVERNRARRLMWESFRLLRPHIARPCRMVLIARRRMMGCRRQDVTAGMAKSLVKAGLLPPEILDSLPGA